VNAVTMAAAANAVPVAPITLLAWLKERDIDEAEVLAAKLGKLGITVLTLVEGGVSREFLEKVRTWRTRITCSGS
jgi:hypothetical protein